MNDLIIILSLLFGVTSEIIFIVIANYLIDKKIESILEKLKVIDNKIGIENPKEPKLIATDMDIVIYKCPNCGRIITRFDKQCWKCGQRFNNNWFDKYKEET